MLILACFGLVCLIKYGTIFNIPRNFIKNIHPILNELFECSLCLGFWSGIFIGFVNYNITKEIEYFLPLISAGSCWFGDSLLRTIQTIELYLDKRLDNEK